MTKPVPFITWTSQGVVEDANGESHLVPFGRDIRLTAEELSEQTGTVWLDPNGEGFTVNDPDRNP